MGIPELPGSEVPGMNGSNRLTAICAWTRRPARVGAQGGPSSAGQAPEPSAPAGRMDAGPLTACRRWPASPRPVRGADGHRGDSLPEGPAQTADCIPPSSPPGPKVHPDSFAHAPSSRNQSWKCSRASRATAEPTGVSSRAHKCCWRKASSMAWIYQHAYSLPGEAPVLRGPPLGSGGKPTARTWAPHGERQQDGRPGTRSVAARTGTRPLPTSLCARVHPRWTLASMEPHSPHPLPSGFSPSARFRGSSTLQHLSD